MKWTEIFAFSRRVRLRTELCRSFWLYMLFFGGGLNALFGVAGLFAYLVHGTTDLWPLFWMGLGLGLLLGVTTYLGSEWVPAVIRLNDKGVERQTFRGIHVYLERWMWTDIAHCRIERAGDSGRDFDILAVYSHSGQVVPIGLHAKVPPARLQGWFETQGHAFQQLSATEFTPLAKYLANPFPPSVMTETSLGG